MSVTGILRSSVVVWFALAAGLLYGLFRLQPAWLVSVATQSTPGARIALLIGAWLLLGVLLVLSYLLFTLSLAFTLSHYWGSPTPPGYQISLAAKGKLFAAEFRDACRAFLVRQAWTGALGPHGELSVPVTPSPYPCVLFVHGYFCNAALWEPMMRQVAKAGFDCTAISLSPVFGSISHYAANIAAAVDRLAARHPSGKVLLVCHSMGGLAARAYFRDHGSAKIDRIITLGTPHQGTRLGQLGIGTNAREMRLASPWRTQLARSEREIGRLFTVLYSHHDEIVFPQANQTLDGAKTIELQGLGHMNLCYDPRVIRLVLAELQAAAG